MVLRRIESALTTSLIALAATVSVPVVATASLPGDTGPDSCAISCTSVARCSSLATSRERGIYIYSRDALGQVLEATAGVITYKDATAESYYVDTYGVPVHIRLDLGSQVLDRTDLKPHTWTTSGPVRKFRATIGAYGTPWSAPYTF